MTANGTQNVIEITDVNFETQVLKSALPFLLDLSAEWCGPCKAIAPLIKELATEYVGRVAFGALDIDKNQKVPAQYQVRSIPTLLLFHEGKVLGQLMGAHPRAHIVELLNKAL